MINPERLGLHLAGTKDKIDLKQIVESGKGGMALNRAFNAVYSASFDNPDLTVSQAINLITRSLAEVTRERR